MDKLIYNQKLREANNIVWEQRREANLDKKREKLSSLFLMGLIFMIILLHFKGDASWVHFWKCPKCQYEGICSTCPWCGESCIRDAEWVDDTE